MISEIIIPDLGGTDEVTLDEWLVQPGTFVKAGTPLLAVTTAKATQEVEAFRDGYLLRVLAPAGTVVELGSVVALLADSMNEEADFSSPAALETVGIAPALTPALSQGERAIAAQATLNRLVPNRIQASPLARRLAREQGIDLARIQGSGPMGQRLKRDVLRAATLQNGRPGDAPAFTASVLIEIAQAQALLARFSAMYEKQGKAAPGTAALAVYVLARLLQRGQIIGVANGLDNAECPICLSGAARMNLLEVAHALATGAAGEPDFLLLDAAPDGLASVAAPILSGVPTLSLGAPCPTMTAILTMPSGKLHNAQAARILRSFKELLDNPLELAFRF